MVEEFNYKVYFTRDGLKDFFYVSGSSLKSCEDSANKLINGLKLTAISGHRITPDEWLLEEMRTKTNDVVARYFAIDNDMVDRLM